MLIIDQGVVITILHFLIYCRCGIAIDPPHGGGPHQGASHARAQNIKLEEAHSSQHYQGGRYLASAVAANVAAIKTSVAGQNGPSGQGGPGQDGGPGQNSGQCLLRGTTIQTASGNRKIEELTVGIGCQLCLVDSVRSVDGALSL